MDWMETEILTGFQRLTCLGLDREPSAEIMPGMVMAWCEAIRAGRSFTEADAPRFRRAFQLLANTRESWPAPVHFLTLLPAPEHIAYQRLQHGETAAKDSAESKR